jgi:hypothetical protein
LYHDDDENHLCQNIMIITIITHNKCDDESQSQQNPMIMLIPKLTQLLFQLNLYIRFNLIRNNDKQTFS